MVAPALVWFRRDLRLADNPALSAAVRSRVPLVFLYVLDEAEGGEWTLGGAARWWLHYSLAALDSDLRRRGAGLALRRGPAERLVRALAEEIGAAAVYWNRIYEPWAEARDDKLVAKLRGQGVEVHAYNASLLFEPVEIRSGKGEPFCVFTPFWRACLAASEPGRPSPAPDRLVAAPAPESERLADWRLTPAKPDWADGLRKAWRPGEREALRRLDAFLRDHAASYAQARDFPARDATSLLSPHLHWGEIGPRQIWWAVRAADLPKEAAAGFLRQLGWREFCHHQLAANPAMPTEPVDRAFSRFPWTGEARTLEAWKRGLTGYPFVDAGMRQLWRDGWMHNRARMVAASFLVKHLLVPWQEGERWFWDTLVDADLANNAANWQWVAGCGADAAPFFRIFNPVLQGERFDPEGDYVRRHVPEVAKLPATYIHRPWTAPDSVLRQAGVRLGETYPRPIVDHTVARRRALVAFAAIEKAKLAKRGRSR